MLPASITPVELLLRRITFICCTCMMLFTSCSDIPDQDACIEIDASKNDGRFFTIDTTRVYDTSESSLRCIIKYKNGSVASGWPVSIFIDSVQTKKITDTSGIAELIWVKQGTYSLEIGNPSEYPCGFIRNLKIPGGRGYDINITLPTNE